jgi:hypothetical protein
MRTLLLVSLSLVTAAGACSGAPSATQDPGAAALAASRDCAKAAGPSAGRAEALKWVDAQEKPCGAVCENAGMQAVSAGVYEGNKNPFFVCVADAKDEGLRPGYNLMPDYGDRCTVGWGGRELGDAPYQCLCQP